MAAKKDKTSAAGAGPYLSAEKQFSGRLEEQARAKRWWMIVGLVQAMGLVLAVAGLVWLGTTSRVETKWTTVSEETGAVLASGNVSNLASVPEKAVAAQLKGVIEGLRTVYTDPRATSKSFSDAYSFIERGSNADAFFRDYFQRTGENPFQQVGSGVQRSVVEVEASEIVGTRTWRLRWIEREVDARGPAEQSIWEGTLSVRQRKTKDENNWIGLSIDGASWGQLSSRALTEPPFAPALDTSDTP